MLAEWEYMRNKINTSDQWLEHIPGLHKYV